MKIKQGMLRSGFAGYKVVDLATGKTIYASVFKADCEQFIYAKSKEV